MATRKVVIIGSGPAGYTAAIYAARANLAPLMLTGFQSGGQLMLTTTVENYPGFLDGVTGPELMETMRKQAERFGTEMIAEDVTSVDFSARPFVVRSGDSAWQANTVIIATGASAKLLDCHQKPRYSDAACRRARPVTASSSRTGPSWSSAVATRRSRKRSISRVSDGTSTSCIAVIVCARRRSCRTARS